MRFFDISTLIIIAAIVGSLAELVPQANKPPATKDSAAALLEAARRALGGQEKLAAVKTLLLKGESRTLNQYFGQHPDAREQYTIKPLEIRALLPDHYLRIEPNVRPDGSQSYRQFGFAGSASLTVSSARSLTPEFNSSTYLQQFEFAEWMLLLFLRTDTALPLRLGEHVRQEATLEFVGRDGFRALVELNRRTLRPERARVDIRKVDSKGEPTGASAGETIWHIGARQDVAGLSVPSRITATREGTLRSEHRYDSITINPPLSPADFPREPK